MWPEGLSLGWCHYRDCVVANDASNLAKFPLCMKGSSFLTLKSLCVSDTGSASSSFFAP